MKTVFVYISIYLLIFVIIYIFGYIMMLISNYQEMLKGKELYTWKKITYSDLKERFNGEIKDNLVILLNMYGFHDGHIDSKKLNMNMIVKKTDSVKRELQD